MYAHNLGLSFGVAEDEVAKAHVFFHHTAQVETHLLRVFIDKAEALGLGARTVFALRAFHDKRHILVAATYGAQQFKARLGIFHATYGEAHVADNAQRVGSIFFIQRHSLFIGASQHHLGASTHTQCGRMAV